MKRREPMRYRAATLMITLVTAALAFRLPVAFERDVPWRQNVPPGQVAETIVVVPFIDQGSDLLARILATWAANSRGSKLIVEDASGRRVCLSALQEHGSLPQWPWAEVLIAKRRPLRLPREKVSEPGLFIDVTERALPADTSWASAAQFGDIDGDGDLDLLVVHSHRREVSRVQLLSNDGTGVFRDESRMLLPDQPFWPVTAQLVDVDSDGDLDLFVPCWGESFGQPQHFVLINDGTGHFRDDTAGRLPADVPFGNELVFGDLDGDGDLDMLATHWVLEHDSTTLYVLRNDGSGIFPHQQTDSLRLPLRAISEVTLADVDGDADLDALVACVSMTFIAISQDTTIIHYPGMDMILMNDGSGRFADATETHWPPQEERTTWAIIPGDIDGDDDEDLLFVLNGHQGAQDRLLINQGNGVFADETAQRLPSEPPGLANAALLADFTGDGALDIFLPCRVATAFRPAPDLLFVNDGSGRFADRSQTDLPQIAAPGLGADAGDVDGDGDLDLLVVNGSVEGADTVFSRIRLYRNTGVFSAVARFAKGEAPQTFRLRAAFPNPFNSGTLIGYDLPYPAHVLLAVYNLRGQRVRTLVEGWRPAGSHQVRWNGTDDSNRLVPSGVYAVRLRAAGELWVRKVVLVR